MSAMLARPNRRVYVKCLVKIVHSNLEMLEDLIQTLGTFEQDIRDNLENGKHVIRDYCENLRFEVVLMHESAIEHLNKVSEDMVKEIDAYEQTLIDSYESNKSRVGQESSEFGEQMQRWTRLQRDCEELVAEAKHFLIENRKSQEMNPLKHDAYVNKLRDLIEKSKETYEQSKQAIFQNSFKYFIANDDFSNHNDYLGFFEHLSHKNAVKPLKTYKKDFFMEARIHVLGDGNLALVDCIGSIHIFDKTNLQLLYQVPTDPFDCVLFLKDDQILTATSEVISFWKYENKQISMGEALTGHTTRVHSMTLLPSGLVASASIDVRIYIWDIEQKKLAKTLLDKTDPMLIYALASVNSGLACAGDSNMVKIWDVEQETVKLRIETGFEEIFKLFVFKNDQLACRSWEKDVHVHDTKTGELLFKLNNFASFAAVILENGSLVHDDSHFIHVRDPSNGTILKTLIGNQKQVAAIAEMPTGEIVCLSDDRSLKFWKI